MNPKINISRAVLRDELNALEYITYDWTRYGKFESSGKRQHPHNVKQPHLEWDQLVSRGLCSNDRTASGLAAHIFGIDEREEKTSIRGILRSWCLNVKTTAARTPLINNSPQPRHSISSSKQCFVSDLLLIYQLLLHSTEHFQISTRLTRFGGVSCFLNHCNPVLSFFASFTNCKPVAQRPYVSHLLTNFTWNLHSHNWHISAFIIQTPRTCWTLAI
jgi:hypothetical protein